MEEIFVLKISLNCNQVQCLPWTYEGDLSEFLTILIYEKDVFT